VIRESLQLAGFFCLFSFVLLNILVMTFLESICRAFEQAKVPYAIVGGHAVALHGALRGTVDIDFVLNGVGRHLLMLKKYCQNLV